MVILQQLHLSLSRDEDALIKKGMDLADYQYPDPSIEFGSSAAQKTRSARVYESYQPFLSAIQIAQCVHCTMCVHLVCTFKKVAR